MIWVDELMSRADRRWMMVLGVPTFVAVWVAALRLGPLAYMALGLVAMLPYSYLYVVFFRFFEVAGHSSRKLPFMAGVLVVQFVVIGGFVYWNYSAG